MNYTTTVQQDTEVNFTVNLLFASFSSITVLVNLSYIFVCFKALKNLFHYHIILALCFSDTFLAASCATFSFSYMVEFHIANVVACSIQMFCISFGIILSYFLIFLLWLQRYLTVRSYNFGTFEEFDNKKYIEGTIVIVFLYNLGAVCLIPKERIRTCSVQMLYGDNFSSFVIILCGPVSLVILLIVLFSCLTSINVWKIYFNKRKIKPLSSIHKVNNDARKCSFKQELHLDTQYYNKQVKEEDSIAKPNMKDIQVTYRKCYTKEVVDRNQLQAECNSDKNTVHAQSQYKVTKHDIKHAVIKSESELKINMEDAFQNLLTERIGNIITEKEIVLVEHKQPIGPPVLINDEPVSKDRTLSHMYRDVDERELAPLSDTGNCEVHVEHQIMKTIIDKENVKQNMRHDMLSHNRRLPLSHIKVDTDTTSKNLHLEEISLTVPSTYNSVNDETEEITSSFKSETKHNEEVKKLREIRAFVTSMMIAIQTILLTLPFILSFWVEAISGYMLPVQTRFILGMALLLNSISNPFIYAWRIPEIRYQFKNLCTRNI